ncbi:hypothetical protein JOD54_001104 [Actinokineospora baliensis]|uniref:hypothetical protein n=1 Tax=Actinokineospora baliensis TaxID=547056 RepID=UPI001957E037|nr:hypothetical protein [Actinokineospora baliensis]MBM7770900.1 hypothetical protein [Actinokineospora baliensis]
MSVVLATKEALFAALTARASGTQTHVTWADPGKLARSTGIWFVDTIESEMTSTGMVPGRRKPTSVEAELNVRVVAVAPGDPVAAEHVVYALRALVEAAALDDLDPASIPGLIDLRPIRSTVASGETGDGRPAAQCDVVLKIRATSRS